METKLRSLLKAVSYRTLGSLATAGLVLVMTNRVRLALSVGVLDSVVKVFAYFVHERLWARIPLGRAGEEQKTGIGDREIRGMREKVEVGEALPLPQVK
jgi:adenylylsulfate kinase